MGGQDCSHPRAHRRWVPCHAEMARALSRESLRHDGIRVAAMRDEDDADCNNMAEIASIRDGVDELPRGSRLVVMLDATSPVHARADQVSEVARQAPGWVLRFYVVGHAGPDSRAAGGDA